jgi:hypothetical protein
MVISWFFGSTIALRDSEDSYEASFFSQFDLNRKLIDQLLLTLLLGFVLLLSASFVFFSKTVDARFRISAFHRLLSTGLSSYFDAISLTVSQPMEAFRQPLCGSVMTEIDSFAAVFP